MYVKVPTLQLQPVLGLRWLSDGLHGLSCEVQGSEVVFTGSGGGGCRALRWSVSALGRDVLVSPES